MCVAGSDRYTICGDPWPNGEGCWPRAMLLRRDETSGDSGDQRWMASQRGCLYPGPGTVDGIENRIVFH